MRQWFLLLGLAPLLLEASCCVQKRDESLSLEDRVAVLEEKCCQKPRGDRCGFFVGISGLYWRAQQAGLEFAVLEPTETDFTIGSDLIPRQKFDLGYRVSAGYFTSWDNADVEISWLTFNTTQKNSATPPTGGALIQLLSDQSTATDQVTSASAVFKLKLNLADLEWGRAINVSKCYVFRPFMGIRGAFISEVYNATYEWPATATTVLSPDYITLENCFRGIGARGGFTSQWNTCCGLSFLGRFASTLAVGKFNPFVTEVAGNPSTTIFDISDPYGISKYLFDIFLGVVWNQVCMSECLNVQFRAGWEGLFVSNMWQWKNVNTNPRPNGDLGLSGLTVTLGLSF